MTTPTPEAIEAIRKAQHAMMWVKLPFGGKDLMISLDANAAHAAAKLAYEAMAPIIAAQAKAEALREAADEFGSWGPTGIAAANALRNRAATIEGKSE